MIEATVDELYLAALKNPGNFPEDLFERCLAEKRSELELKILKKLEGNSSDVAKLIGLVIDDSNNARFSDTPASQKREVKLAGHARLLERLEAFLTGQAGS